MAPTVAALAGFGALALLLLARVPVGVAMAIVGVGGFAAMVGPGPAVNLLSQSPLRTVSEYELALIPMFILMGNLAVASRMSRDLFRASNAWMGGLRGGTAMSTIVACGGFAAISGSSVATAATMGQVAYPEMRRVGYSRSAAAGTIAAGGTLGIVIPPSAVLAIYGILTEQDIGKLFVAGIVPGLIAILLYLAAVRAIVWFRRDAFPAAAPTPWRLRFASLGPVWPIATLFVFVIGGIYGGVFTPAEAAGMGAVGAFVIALAMGRMDRATLWRCMSDTVRTSAAIFLILIGAIIFGYFLAITQVPQSIAAALLDLGLGPWGTLALILLIYVLLGCVLDAMALIVLTVPIVFPIVVALGFDPIWFGVILVIVVELALITPPIGLNLFVIKSVVPDVALPALYRGILPFVAADLARLVLLAGFPGLVLFLPGLME